MNQWWSQFGSHGVVKFTEPKIDLNSSSPVVDLRHLAPVVQPFFLLLFKGHMYVFICLAVVLIVFITVETFSWRYCIFFLFKIENKIGTLVFVFLFGFKKDSSQNKTNRFVFCFVCDVSYIQEMPFLIGRQDLYSWLILVCNAKTFMLTFISKALSK